MKNNLAALMLGLLFGAGLVISGMSNPDKVLNFLNVAGHWDPSLLFVLGGAVIVTFIGFKWVLTLEMPKMEEQFHLPSNTLIDKPLIMGAIIFGIGWGMSGYCPGPALSTLSFMSLEPVLFLASLMAGFWITRYLQK